MDFMDFTTHTTILIIFEFGWQTFQIATRSSKTAHLLMKFQISLLEFYGAVFTKKMPFKKFYEPFYGYKFSIKMM